MGHITPKPLDMIERIIKASSNEGDLVLDCFAGSGTTAVAAKKLKRNFICGEMNQEYVAISQQRLNEMNQTKSNTAVICINGSDGPAFYFQLITADKIH